MAEKKTGWWKEVRDVHGEIKARRKGKTTDNLHDQYYYDPFLWGYIWGSSFDLDDFSHHGDGNMSGEIHHHNGQSNGSRYNGGHHNGGDFHHDGGGFGDTAADIGEGIFVSIILTTIIAPVLAHTVGATVDGVKNWSGAIRYVNARRRNLCQK